MVSQGCSVLRDAASRDNSLLVTRNLSHQLSGLLSHALTPHCPISTRATWGSAGCQSSGRDGDLLCVSLCCAASLGSSAHLRPGHCSLMPILSARQGAGTTLGPGSFSCSVMGGLFHVRDHRSISQHYKPHPRAAKGGLSCEVGTGACHHSWP